MNVHLVFYTIDATAVLSVALLGAAFVIAQPRNFNARLLAFICFNTIFYLLFSRYIHSPLIPPSFRIDLGALTVPARYAMNVTPGLFMILAFSLFQDGQRFPRWLLVLFAVQLLLEEPLPLLLSVEVPQESVPFEIVPAVLQVVFVGFAMFWGAANWRTDLIEERRHLRIGFLAVVGTYIAVNVIAGRIVFPLSGASFLVSHVAMAAFCAVVALAMLGCILRWDSRMFTEPGQRAAAPAAASPATDERDVADLARIEQAFRDEHLYREPGLTVGSLAARLTIPEYRLRKLIHEQLGYRNFNALLHHYRIEEARVRLVSPEEKHLPILTVALSVGYQSINPFNRAFREICGMTPSELRKQAPSAGDQPDRT